MNFCRTCQLDFGSLGAFDAHRVGKHSHLFSAEHPDGRRCLQDIEMLEKGWRQNQHGRWVQPVPEKDVLRIRELRKTGRKPLTHVVPAPNP